MYEKKPGTTKTPTADPVALLKRYDRLKSDRVNWDSMWEELAKYLMPGKVDFITTTTRGSKRAAEVYDYSDPCVADPISLATWQLDKPINQVVWPTLP